MNRISFLLVAAAIISTNVGCGCCSWCLPKAGAVARPPAPACPPPATPVPPRRSPTARRHR